MIRQAQATVPRGLSLRFVEAPAEELPLPDGSFDLVLSTMSFHHWADQQRGLAEVRRVLAPQGLFVLTDIVLAAWLSRPLAWSGDRFVTRQRLDAMLGAARLRLVRSTSLPKLRFRGTRITLARAVE
jgi:ubiquinone/menaquinone biosynthesis C-methylase UbiE